MTVIEVRGRGGQLVERFRTRGPTVAVGRAFDNDLILDDAYVSAHHLRLARVAGAWHFEDLSSENGVKHGGEPSSRGVLHSGDVLRVGHTSLHLYDDDHPVPPPLRLSGAEGRLVRLGAHAIWPIAVLAFLGVDLLAAYLESYSEFRPFSELQSVLVGVVAVVLFASFWALWGRISKHRASFFAHLSIWSLASLSDSILPVLLGVLTFNATSRSVGEASSLVANATVATLALYASLVLATHLRALRRVGAAVGIVALGLAVYAVDDLDWHEDFSSSPDYLSALSAPAFLFVRPVPEAALVDTLPDLFDRADGAREDPDEHEGSVTTPSAATD